MLIAHTFQTAARPGSKPGCPAVYFIYLEWCGSELIRLLTQDAGLKEPEGWPAMKKNQVLYERSLKKSSLRIEYIFISRWFPLMYMAFLSIPSQTNPAFSSTRAEA